MNIKFLNKRELNKKVKQIDDIYWSETFNGRWVYISEIITELKKLKPKTILELGSYKVNLTNISDNMDLNLEYIDLDNINNKKFIQNATNTPWNIEDKYYDVFIGLQVFEHFEDNKQSEVFDEIVRTSKNAILSFPYLWNKPEDKMHHMIDFNKINEWTNGVIPEKIIYIKIPSGRKRVIYIFKF